MSVEGQNRPAKTATTSGRLGLDSGRSLTTRPMTPSRRKRTEAVAHLLERRGAEADSARLGERFEEVQFVPEMERFVYRRRRRDA